MESSIKNYQWLVAWVFVFLFSSAADAASDPAIIEAAKKEGQLTLWTSSDLRTASRVVERFEQKYPFLKVKVFRTGTGALHNKMITEALAGQQNWDVMNSQMFTRDLIKRKLLARYKSPEADKLLDANFRDELGYWTAIYAIPFVLGYNANLVKPTEVPKTYAELLSARWKGSNISIDQDGYELLQGLVLTLGKRESGGLSQETGGAESDAEAREFAPRAAGCCRRIPAAYYHGKSRAAGPARRRPNSVGSAGAGSSQLSRHCVGRARGASKRRKTVYRLYPVTRRSGSAPQRAKDSGAPRR